jgi:hypothetical protein
MSIDWKIWGNCFFGPFNKKPKRKLKTKRKKLSEIEVLFGEEKECILCDILDESVMSIRRVDSECQFGRAESVIGAIDPNTKSNGLRRDVPISRKKFNKFQHGHGLFDADWRNGG